MSRGVVTLPSGKTLSVEVADTEPLIKRGYMFRERVPEGEGMIFLLWQSDFHAFWMKNCLTALDMLWIDESWSIVHIAPEVPPCKSDPCPTYSPMRPALYVLELGPGQAASLALKLGDRISFTPPKPPSK